MKIVFIATILETAIIVLVLAIVLVAGKLLRKGKDGARRSVNRETAGGARNARFAVQPEKSTVR